MLGAVEAALRARGAGVRRLDAAALVGEVEIDDTVLGDGAGVRWRVGGGDVVPATTRGVLNRLDDAHLWDALGAVADEDRAFAWEEWRAYLTYALACFDNVMDPPAGQELAGDARTLPWQWQAARAAGADVPAGGHYGRVATAPARLARSARLVVNPDPADALRWRDGARDPGDGALLYVRPPGRAFVCQTVDGHALFDDWAPDGRRAAVAAMAGRLAQRLRLRVVRSLWFADGERVCFAAAAPGVSPEVLRAQREPLLDRLAGALLGEGART